VIIIDTGVIIAI